MLSMTTGMTLVSFCFVTEIGSYYSKTLAVQLGHVYIKKNTRLKVKLFEQLTKYVSTSKNVIQKAPVSCHFINDMILPAGDNFEELPV